MILIYQDKGISELSIFALKQSLKYFFPNLNIKCVNSKYIIQEDLNNILVLIIPGGADLPYCEKLNGIGNKKIQKYIYNGGIYIGICAGAYYACSFIDFTGNNYKIKEKRELALFEGIGIGSIAEFTKNKFYDSTIKTKAVIPIYYDNNIIYSYYHGGLYFQNTTQEQVLALYKNKKPVIIHGKYGKGKFLLSGIHFEINKNNYYQFNISQNKDFFKKEEEYQIYNQLNLCDSNKIWEYLKEFLRYDIF